ncbi:hypothetical protein K443DRAFT_83877 [Laccaria amethystina LaAM-08-1]|uniref:C2H2-type domain-containing protein n=1 Tax=Laccaria amethystina LaAM-08-1 TaxID=1095629 RepID=A0A0C9X9W5_9AGAR|nr:hypothetical protein K443DRAFT_83877 [Laccaria amethystina LaAM-08-1]
MYPFACVEPLCSTTSEFTEQCTDQCVVVACTDPEHPEAICHPGEHVHCDLVCDSSANCTDCNGFDAFLQCCTDYHSYLAEPRPFDQCEWSIDDWCKSVAPNVVPPLPPPQPVYSSPSMIPCMWGECKASFASLSELVGHVNLEHLRQPLFLSNTPETDPLPCLWQNCDLSWSPECIASSSTASEFDSLRAALETHLLQDHLGLKDHPLGRQQAIASQATPSPTETPPIISSTSHICASSTHICRWQSCGKSFESCDALTAHITTTHVGSGKTQYECFWEGCQRHGEHGFSSKQKICRHVQSHTGHRPFQCKICQQNFSEAATLQQHMRRHTQEKPYICDFPGCGKSFAITGALTIHKRTHNGHKPFKCTYCERAFAESSNLSKHLRTHTGARPYTCAEPNCGKSFARPDQLSRHMGVHQKKAAR